MQSDNAEPLFQKAENGFFLSYALSLSLSPSLSLSLLLTMVFFICYLTSVPLDTEILAG